MKVMFTKNCFKAISLLVVETFIISQFTFFVSFIAKERQSYIQQQEFSDTSINRRIRSVQPSENSPISIDVPQVVASYQERLPADASYLERLQILKDVLKDFGFDDLSIFHPDPQTWEDIAINTILQGETDLQERLLLYRAVREASSFNEVLPKIRGKYYAGETIEEFLAEGKTKFSDLNVNEREQLKGAFYYDLVEEATEKTQMFAQVFLPEHIIPSKPAGFFGRLSQWLGNNKLTLYNLAYKGLAGFLAYNWFAGRDIFSNPSPVGIATSIGQALLLYYMYKGIADLYGTAFISMTVPPKVYSENEFIVKNGIQADQKTAILHTVYATDFSAVDEAVDKMEKSFLANGGLVNKNLVMVYGSDTRPTDTGVDVILHELELIKRLQEKYPGQVFYYHRLVNFAKKWGNYQDFMQYIMTGENKPKVYTGDNWDESKRRNPAEPLFQLKITREKLLEKYKDNAQMLARINAVLTEDVAETGMLGDFSQITGENKIKYVAITDADNLWPENAIIRTIAKMVNNPDIAIAQPSIRVQNTGESRYAAWAASLPQALMKFIPEANAFLSTEQFMGKGVVDVEKYYQTMMQPGNEILDPTTRCHDFRESLYLKTAYLTDVEILESAPTNLFQEIKRQYGWRPGDLQGLYHEKLPRFAPYIFYKKLLARDPDFDPLDPLPRSQARILEFIGRTVMLPVAFTTFLMSNWIQSLIPGILKTGDPVLDTITTMTALAGVILIPSIIGPISQKLRLGEYNPATAPIRLTGDILKGVANVANSTLLLMQFLYDAPISLWSARQQLVAAQQGGGAPAWNPMAAIKTNLGSGLLGIARAYSERKIATAIAAGMLVTSVLVGYIYPQTTAHDWARSIWPIASSFFLGPLWAWYTGQSETALRDAAMSIEADVQNPDYKEVGDALYQAAGKDLEKKFVLIQDIYKNKGGMSFAEDLTKVAVNRGGDVWDTVYHSDLALSLWNKLAEPIRNSLAEQLGGEENAMVKLYNYFVGLAIKVNAEKGEVIASTKNTTVLAAAEFKAAMDFDMEKFDDSNYRIGYINKLYNEYDIANVTGLSFDEFRTHIEAFLLREKELEDNSYN